MGPPGVQQNEDDLFNREAMRDHKRLGAAVRGGGEQLERSASVGLFRTRLRAGIGMSHSLQGSIPLFKPPPGHKRDTRAGTFSQRIELAEISALARPRHAPDLR